MRYAEEIVKEIESRKKFDTNNCIIDDGWEDYIRGGVKNMATEERIKELARKQAERDSKTKSSYSLNPLDDIFDEDEEEE